MTLVSQTARISSRDAVLAFDDFMYSSMKALPSFPSEDDPLHCVFEIPALLTNKSSRPRSARICPQAAAMDFPSVTSI